MKVLFYLSIALGIFSISATLPAPSIYKLDASASTFKWTGKKVTGSHWGYIKFSDGQLIFEGETLKGGQFTIDMSSIECQDLEGEYAHKLEGHLKADDFFGTDKFKVSTLNIRKATPVGKDGYKIDGDLNIKGITNPVSFNAKVTKNGEAINAMASFKIDRTKFGIKYGSGTFFSDLGDKTIENEFQVDVNIVANKSVDPAGAMKDKKIQGTTKPKMN